jgi:hypothetical protein
MFLRAGWLGLLTLLPLGTSLRGQDAAAELGAATQRLQQALGKARGLLDTSFRANWGEVKLPGQVADEGPQNGVQVLGFPGQGSAAGSAEGSWHRDLLHVRFVGQEEDELLTAGRFTVCRSKDLAWAPRVARFADGNQLGFTPDPQLLLATLAQLGVQVSHREVGELDGRPVEFLSVALQPEQVAELLHRCALPSAGTGMGAVRVLNLMVAAANQTARQAPPLPSDLVDLAIAIDPAAGVVHRLQFRTWAKNQGNRVIFAAGGNVVRAQAAARVVVGQALNVEIKEKQEEGEGDAKPPAEATLRYREGLPERPCQGLQVSDYTIVLRDHGKAVAPKIDGELQQLLLR